MISVHISGRGCLWHMPYSLARGQHSDTPPAGPGASESLSMLFPETLQPVKFVSWSCKWVVWVVRSYNRAAPCILLINLSLASWDTFIKTNTSLFEQRNKSVNSRGNALGQGMETGSWQHIKMTVFYIVYACEPSFPGSTIIPFYAVPIIMSSSSHCHPFYMCPVMIIDPGHMYTTHVHIDLL